MRNWSDRVSRLVVAGSLTVLALSGPLGVAFGETQSKVTICHLPPGNPSNVQLITVGAPAVAAHVAKHGDAVCAAGDSNCCANADGEMCTNLQDDANNCGACGNVCPEGERCAAGGCTVCPLVEGLACYWLDCFNYGDNCCWDLNGFPASDPAGCQDLDSCNAGGGGESGGGCYKWANSSDTAIFPPWP
jgi:hypothetical protein